MKRCNNLYNSIISIENLKLADEKARKNKTNRFEINEHDKISESNLNILHLELKNKTYKTSKYSIFKVFEPKERDVYKLPYYPCRIVHHAIMNILEPIWVKSFTSNTYSCIKGKGIHGAFKDLKYCLHNDKENTTYCLKLDIKKFYPSINHNVLKNIIRKKIKDNDLLWLLDEIIDSVDIGNYLSQFFANLYLNYFDHWLKEKLKIKYYFRYADDIVILNSDKEYLHKLLYQIKEYLSINLDLKVKSNYQIFPISSRGIDFVGYKFYHNYILVRKTIKKAFCKKLFKGAKTNTIASYYGWLKHANSKNLLKKLTIDYIEMKKFSDLNIKPKPKSFSGIKKNIEEIINIEIILNDFKITKSKFNKDNNDNNNNNCLSLDYNLNGVNYITFSGSIGLMEIFEMIPKLELPFTATIVKEHKRFILK